MHTTMPRYDLQWGLILYHQTTQRILWYDTLKELHAAYKTYRQKGTRCICIRRLSLLTSSEDV